MTFFCWYLVAHERFHSKPQPPRPEWGWCDIDRGRFGKRGLLLNPWDWLGLWDLQIRAVPSWISVHSRPSRLSRAQSQRRHTATMGPFFSPRALTQPPPPPPLSVWQKQCVTPPPLSFPPFLSLHYFSLVFRWCGENLGTQQAPSRPSGSISLETSIKPRCSSGLDRHTPTRRSIQEPEHLSEHFRKQSPNKPALLRHHAGSHVSASSVRFMPSARADFTPIHFFHALNTDSRQLVIHVTLRTLGPVLVRNPSRGPWSVTSGEQTIREDERKSGTSQPTPCSFFLQKGLYKAHAGTVSLLFVCFRYNILSQALERSQRKPEDVQHMKPLFCLLRTILS